MLKFISSIEFEMVYIVEILFKICLHLSFLFAHVDFVDFVAKKYLTTITFIYDIKS